MVDASNNQLLVGFKKPQNGGVFVVRRVSPPNPHSRNGFEAIFIQQTRQEIAC